MKKLLLHTCCAPCSTTAIERLAEQNLYDISVIYYNPNIYPQQEYLKRKNEQIRYLKLLKDKGININFIDADYDASVFFDATKGLENEREGGARCSVCFALRLDYVAKYAKNNGYDVFATSLTVSPHKNAELINDIGNEIASKYRVAYLPTNFKKQNGYLRSIELSKNYNIYRQNYCGCKFSIWF